MIPRRAGRGSASVTASAASLLRPGQDHHITPRNHLGNLINDPAGTATATWGSVATAFRRRMKDGYHHFLGDP